MMRGPSGSRHTRRIDSRRKGSRSGRSAVQSTLTSVSVVETQLAGGCAADGAHPGGVGHATPSRQRGRRAHRAALADGHDLAAAMRSANCVPEVSHPDCLPARTSERALTAPCRPEA